jgi:hypothetical protein
MKNIDKPTEQFCSICGYEFRSFMEERNADPVASGSCCSDCDATYVMPARMRQVGVDCKPKQSMTDAVSENLFRPGYYFVGDLGRVITDPQIWRQVCQSVFDDDGSNLFGKHHVEGIDFAMYPTLTGTGMFQCYKSQKMFDVVTGYVGCVHVEDIGIGCTDEDDDGLWPAGNKAEQPYLGGHIVHFKGAPFPTGFSEDGERAFFGGISVNLRSCS